jgi:hypothetical protein
MGGVFCKRNEQLLRPFYDLKSTNGELKTSKYGDSFIKQLRGISYADLPFITRTHNWELSLKNQNVNHENLSITLLGNGYFFMV